MTDLIPIRRELLERLADKNAFLHHTRKAQDELRAAIDSAPCDPRCAETCVRASMCATCMNALAEPVRGEVKPAAWLVKEHPNEFNGFTGRYRAVFEKPRVGSRSTPPLPSPPRWGSWWRR